MAEYIKLTEELMLAMRAGAKAILNTKKYHGTSYMFDVFSDSPKEIPYLDAAEILYAASEKEPEDVTPVRHGRWFAINPCKDVEGWIEYDYQCSICKEISWEESNYCQNCGARMDLEES